MKHKLWYLQYTKEITKEVFVQIIDALKSQGLKAGKNVCDYNLTYKDFIRGGYLRSWKGQENDPIKEGEFGTDNNDQSIENEIFIRDIKQEVNYEIY